MTQLRILFCASEVSPYAKTGGLADVTGTLPHALKKLGCDVRIFLPLYRCVRDKLEDPKPLAENIPLRIGMRTFHVHFWEAETSEGLPVYFMEKDEFFDRSDLYGTKDRGDYEDNAERYIAFCRAVHSLCIHLDWFPDIFHLHDWQTALISAYHHHHWAHDPRFAETGKVFTIHNIGYQGIFPSDYFDLTHLPPEAFSMQGLEYWGRCNFLKAGLVYSDFLTTVSPSYSREIQQPELGCGLDGILRERSHLLAGILNGVDYNVWNPEVDPLIAQRYDAHDLSGKHHCKKALCTKVKLPKKQHNQPLFGIISRLENQKGFDLIHEILEELMRLSVSLVILGIGDVKTQNRLREMADRYPSQLKVILKFDERLAHAIEAGADFFLMPSRYEPCGLNQMYSLRYGTIPIVHAVGGLEDSVVDVLRYPNTGTGFKFYEYSPGAFFNAIRSALELFGDSEKWREIIQRAMARDFSWDRSAKGYLDIYERVLQKKRERRGEIAPVFSSEDAYPN